MVCGAPPFQGESFRAVLAKKAAEQPVRPRLLRSGLPDDVERVILHALAAEPDARPATMPELAAEILAAQAAWLARCATATRPAAGRRTGHGGTAVRQPAYRAAASPNG